MDQPIHEPSRNLAESDGQAASLLSAEGLGRLLGDRWLWRGLSFDLCPGETLAVSGPSGSGKTLLLRSLSLLDTFSEGRIVYGGHDSERWDVPAYRTHVLYLHQRPALFEGTVEENLRRIFSLHRRRRHSYQRERAAELLERLGRPAAMLEQRVERLSGGEAETVALVRALLAEPNVLLLDEPTASLDEETARRAEEVVKAWKREAEDRACLWVSHSPSQRDRVADRMLVLASNGDGGDADTTGDGGNA